MATAETSEKKTPAAKKPVAKKSVAVQDLAARATYLRDLRPVSGFNKLRIRVSCGEGFRGKTSERGTKGTKARYQVPVHLENGQMPLHMCLPKLCGFENPSHAGYQAVSLDRFGETFPEDGTLTVADLVAKGLVRKEELAKAFDNDEAGAKLDLTVDTWSQSTKTKVETKGGNLAAR